ncbi:hypothetical protein [Paenibacillus sp. NPDC055715]
MWKQENLEMVWKLQKWVIDTRFNNKEEQVKVYNEYVYTGRSLSGVVLKATNEEIGNSVKVRGHVYEN